MQILTIDDPHFTELLAAWSHGRPMGRFSRDGKVQIVTATKHFLLILSEADRNQITLRPTRTLQEAERLALQLLDRERERGNTVEISPLG